MTLREFERALQKQGNTNALELLAALRAQEEKTRKITPRYFCSVPMSRELAQEIVKMDNLKIYTRQDIAHKLRVNQGRVTDVLKYGKYL